jgi:hypothetical protein
MYGQPKASFAEKWTDLCKSKDRQASQDKDVHPVEFPGGNPIQQGELSLHNRTFILPACRQTGLLKPWALLCCANLPGDWALENFGNAFLNLLNNYRDNAALGWITVDNK